MRRPSAGADGAGAPGAALRLVRRTAVRRVVLEAGNLRSPVENGRWKTAPGGCTVIDVTSGRRLRGR